MEKSANINKTRTFFFFFKKKKKEKKKKKGHGEKSPRNFVAIEFSNFQIF